MTPTDRAWPAYLAAWRAHRAGRVPLESVIAARHRFDRSVISTARANGERGPKKARLKCARTVSAITKATCGACGGEKPSTAFRRTRKGTLFARCNDCIARGFEVQPHIEPGDLVHYVEPDGSCCDAVYLRRFGAVVQLEVEHQGGAIPAPRTVRYGQWHRVGEACPGF